MIKAKEIQQKALKGGVRDTQIEKDYILSWILRGIAQHEALSKYLVFKGGTVLKKIYFDDYRFSEDLDFTLLDPAITNEQILARFNETFTYVRETTNIPFSLRDNHEHQDGGINFLSRMLVHWAGSAVINPSNWTFPEVRSWFFHQFCSLLSSTIVIWMSMCCFVIHRKRSW
jgi:hypothetical protein